MSETLTAAVRNLFDIPIHAVTMAEAVALCDRAIETRRRLAIGVVNAAKVVNMRRDDELRRAVLSSDVILADGFSIVLAARLLGTPLPQRVAGIDLMEALFARADERGYGVYCLGATDEVLSLVVREVQRRFPGARLAGHHHGYFKADEESRVVEAITRSRADILFVAMTSPKKERFLARWGASLAVPVCHGVGGSFDVLAGKVRRAPESWQRLGLEWLYRVRQEPLRLWRRYLVTNSLFAGLLTMELGKRLRNGLASLVGL